MKRQQLYFLYMHVCVRMNVCVEVGGGGVLKRGGVYQQYLV